MTRSVFQVMRSSLLQMACTCRRNLGVYSETLPVWLDQVPLQHPFLPLMYLVLRGLPDYLVQAARLLAPQFRCAAESFPPPGYYSTSAIIHNITQYVGESNVSKCRVCCLRIPGSFTKFSYFFLKHVVGPCI